MAQKTKAAAKPLSQVKLGGKTSKVKKVSEPKSGRAAKPVVGKGAKTVEKAGKAVRSVKLEGCRQSCCQG
ncbi:MAG: hypothetical protein HC888_12640 [Candidatus Competibacteraceae bacterium]|nr:hypothetical protein [Candidatus Competibacteraceae bacterium]